MFGLDWFTIVVIGIFILLFWGIHERDKDVPYNPNKKCDDNFMHRYSDDYSNDPACMLLPGNSCHPLYEFMKDTSSPLD